MSRRFLLMHATQASGHHRASLALAEALRRLDSSTSVACLDAFRFTSPLIQWAILRSYHSLIRHQPDVWEYLYDNPGIHRRVQRLRGLLSRYHAARLRRVLDEVRPDAIVCTQAYPCGMVADFKRHHGLATPLIGVLTDHAPHLYWFHDTVDLYVVPSEQVRQRFLERGVPASRIRVIGIPIDPAFSEAQDRQAAARRYGVNLSDPVILLMGGSGGLGALRQIVTALDTLPQRCQVLVVAGTNQPLLAWIRRRRFRHRVLALGYVQEIPALMDLATILISKPGGLTMSEAMAKRVPMVIINPIPGQEAYNARYLLSQGAALAASPDTVRQTVRDLLENPERLVDLRSRLEALARPLASLETARLLCTLADAFREGEAVLPAAPARSLPSAAQAGEQTASRQGARQAPAPFGAGQGHGLFLAYRLGLALAPRLPRSLLDLAARGLANVHRWRHPEAVAAVRSRTPLVREVFVSFWSTVMEFLGCQDPARLEVTIEGAGHLEEACRHQRGVVLLTCHLGNWELGAAVVAMRLKARVAAVAQPHAHPGIDRLFIERRRGWGVATIPTDERALWRSLAHLRAGGVLGLLADKHFEGPAQLSRRSGAPVVPIVMLRTAPWRFRLALGAPIWPQDASAAPRPVAELVEAYAATLHRYLAESPTQWVLFEPAEEAGSSAPAEQKECVRIRTGETGQVAIG